MISRALSSLLGTEPRNRDNNGGNLMRMRSLLSAWPLLAMLVMLVPVAGSGQETGAAAPGAPAAQAPDPLAKYRRPSPYSGLTPSRYVIEAPAAGRPVPFAMLAAPSGPPPAVCAKPPPPEHVVPPKHASNAVPYRPFPATWQQTLDSLTTGGEIPGAVIIVKSPDWGVRVGVTGMSNLATGAPMAPWMQFRIGSVTKLFLTQAILRLEQDGKIRLSDPVPRYLGDNPLVTGIPNIANITVGELLQM